MKLIREESKELIQGFHSFSHFFHIISILMILILEFQQAFLYMGHFHKNNGLFSEAKTLFKIHFLNF